MTGADPLVGADRFVGADLLVDDVVAFAAQVPDPRRLWRRVDRSFGASLFEDAGSRPEAIDDVGVTVAAMVDNALADGRPWMGLRLGDGEGTLLAYELAGHDRLTEQFGSARLVKHLGRPVPAEDVRGELVPDLTGAIATADLVGIPRRSSVVTSARRARRALEEGRSDAFGWCAGAFGQICCLQYLGREATTLGLADKVATSAAFSHSLLAHYRSLVHGRRVRVVSCRPVLAERLVTEFGATHVEFHAVPVQAHFAASAADGVGHYPHRYRELLEELRCEVESGELVLVAAGLLAKAYCHAVKQGGGVALDIGGVADLWAGVITRTAFTDEMRRQWCLL
ncbi:MAG: hypothetical protein JJU45_16615 [Acidimicrobiia bacterium]|nr:hypothetical protein [Acidimicrobiia bacterium]